MPRDNISKIIMTSASLLLLFFVDFLNASGYYPPTSIALGPWYGNGCPNYGTCACSESQNAVDDINCQLDHLKSYDIPVTVFLFDGSTWSKANTYSTLACTGEDCCNWNLGRPLINRFHQDSLKVLLHYWGGCHDSTSYQRAYDSLGTSLLGFYLDDGCTDSEAKRAIDWMTKKNPGNVECNLKAFQSPFYTVGGTISDSGLRLGNICYVNDLSTDFYGMKIGIKRIFAKSTLLAGPYNEFTAYSSNPVPDVETYTRRLHFGCFQVVMANTPLHNEDSWDSTRFGSILIERYRYYSWLHWELVPYLYSCVYNMHENPSQPVFQSPDSINFSTMLGNELFVAYVTDYISKMDIVLPPGQWIDYWDESQIYQGKIFNFPVPIGHEPIFIRNGSIIPMRVKKNYTGHGSATSAECLTVLVYPKDTCSFRYREESTQRWITFTSQLSGDQLSIESMLYIPSQPVLYRIERWLNPPKTVSISASGVLVNQGGSIPQKLTEEEVNSATGNAWYYDSISKRLIIKFSSPVKNKPAGLTNHIKIEESQGFDIINMKGRKTFSSNIPFVNARSFSALKHISPGVYIVRPIYKNHSSVSNLEKGSQFIYLNF